MYTILKELQEFGWQDWDKIPYLNIFDPGIVQDVITDASNNIDQKFLHAISSEYLGKITLLWQGFLWQQVINDYPEDKRFNNPIWREKPLFNYIRNLYFETCSWLRKISQESTLPADQKRKLRFYLEQTLSALSPTNYISTNPDVLEKIKTTHGENLIDGLKNFVRDLRESKGMFLFSMSDPDAFVVGKNLAVTPGKVIFRNRLLELIKYTPATKKTHAQPLLIIPPWINKFYIFDLQQDFSFVKWLVDAGVEVYMVSWVNPSLKHTDLTLTDYVFNGIKEAVDHLRQFHDSINVLGYCAGGISLSCYLSTINNDAFIKSATFVATPVDGNTMGDLLVYLCKEQLRMLQEHSKKSGLIDGNAMAWSFNLLRPSDLIWSYYVNNYLLGQKPKAFDFLHWNTDTTRLPAKMHYEYLSSFFIKNLLLKPRGFKLGGNSINLRQIKIPIFVMAAIDDHIAPWKSSYALMNLAQGKKTFILSGSGHVAGVFNHPNKHKYCHWRFDKNEKTAEDWLQKAQKYDGSWWPIWKEWLNEFLGPLSAPKKQPSDDLGDAPGSYVLD